MGPARRGSPARNLMQKRKLIVIGNGMAGARLLAELLARGGERYDITAFGDEPGGAYNRILLSDVLNGSKAPTSIVTHPLDWYERGGVKLRAGEKIVSIDRHNQTVKSDAGATDAFDELVIATGSRALVPPLEGLISASGERKKGVFAMRTLADCHNIAGYAAKVGRAAVVGGGLLGLEAARGLMQHGAQVHLIHRSSCLMSAQLDQNASDLLRRQIEMMGITVHLDKQTTGLIGEEQVAGLKFRDETELRCDMVVLACGITPNVELARESGLAVERAIVVDDGLEVAPHIYAIGECAQHCGVTYGLVAPVWDQARVLAQRLSGQNPDAQYQGSNISTRLKVMGVELASMGETREREGDEVIQYVEARKGRYKKLVIRDNRLAGAILLGDARKAAMLMQVFDSQMALPDERASLFFDIGKAAVADVTTLADDATVCNCNAVSAGTIRDSIKGGADDLGKVMAATRAGTGCGTCKGLVKEFVVRP